jgi:hypothetical protein
MKKVMSYLAAFLLTISCFAQQKYTLLHDFPIIKDSWKYLEYYSLMDSINLKQSDGSGWEALLFHTDLSVSDADIKMYINSSSNVLDIIDKLGGVDLGITKEELLIPIADQYYTIRKEDDRKVVVIMFPI